MDNSGVGNFSKAVFRLESHIKIFGNSHVQVANIILNIPFHIKRAFCSTVLSIYCFFLSLLNVFLSYKAANIHKNSRKAEEGLLLLLLAHVLVPVQNVHFYKNEEEDTLAVKKLDVSDSVSAKKEAVNFYKKEAGLVMHEEIVRRKAN